MRTNCKRFDAGGNVILPHAEMLLYYKKDPHSLDIVRRFMPHRYICIPDIEIRLDVQDCRTATIYSIFPGETKERVVELSDRNLNVLRHMWRWGRKRWVMEKKTGYFVFRRAGCVVMDPLKRYGIYR